MFTNGQSAGLGMEVSAFKGNDLSTSVFWRIYSHLFTTLERERQRGKSHSKAQLVSYDNCYALTPILGVVVALEVERIIC